MPQVIDDFIIPKKRIKYKKKRGSAKKLNKAKEVVWCKKFFGIRRR